MSSLCMNMCELGRRQFGLHAVVFAWSNGLSIWLHDKINRQCLEAFETIF
jgi:hypothetical protein